mgnify:CR=1 FL=1
MTKTIITLCAALATAGANAIYLDATNQSLEAYMGGAASSTNPTYVVSWQDVTSSGMTIPQSSTNGSLNGATDVTILAAPGASTTRQVAHINIYNADDSIVNIYVQKDVGGTEYGLIAVQLNPGNTLEWSRDGGWNIINSTQTDAFAIESFTSSGTWTKPAGLKYALVVGVGAGGGGGSGRQGAAGENRFGGSGGSGGAVVWRLLNAGELGATVTVTINSGGTGASGQASTSSNGTAGTAGGDALFGSILTADGGNGGNGGTTAAAGAVTGGLASACAPAYGPFATNGGNSSQSSAATTSGAGSTGMNGTYSTAGGAGGCGINTSNTSATSAGSGGSIYNNGVLIPGPSASGASQPNGASNQALLLFMSTSLSSVYGLGTGGAGGYPGSGGSGAGGNGGNYGAGGGGGTGTLNGTTSGAGGNGGGGLIQVLEVF